MIPDEVFIHRPTNEKHILKACEREIKQQEVPPFLHNLLLIYFVIINMIALLSMGSL